MAAVAGTLFAHALAANLQAQKPSFSQSLSPPEAAEAGAHTVGHSPQGCRPFWGFPGQPAFIAGCFSAGAATRRNLFQYRTQGKSLSTDKNLYIRLITRRFCQPAQNYLSDNTPKP